MVLVVSGPGLIKEKLSAPVATTQIAPTVLQALGLDPEALDSVRQENTEVLPGPF